jgi:hypothetical protein
VGEKKFSWIAHQVLWTVAEEWQKPQMRVIVVEHANGTVEAT